MIVKSWRLVVCLCFCMTAIVQIASESRAEILYLRVSNNIWFVFCVVRNVGVRNIAGIVYASDTNKTPSAYMFTYCFVIGNK